MGYTRTTWENTPSTATPISAANLNNIEEGILGNEMNKNLLINGNFDVWQRGTSFPTVSVPAYTSDRWEATVSSAAIAISRIANTQPTINAVYSYQIVNGTSQVVVLRQKIENINNELYGIPFTLSFYIVSPASTTISATINGTTKKQSVVTGLNKVEFNFSADTSFVAGTSYEVRILNGTLPAGTYEILQVKLEANDKASKFIPKTYAEELRDCQRYYYKIEGSINKRLFLGVGSSTTAFIIPIPEILNILRSTPTVTFLDLQLLRDGISIYTVLGCSINTDSLQIATTGYVTGAFGSLRTSSADGYIAFDAEL